MKNPKLSISEQAEKKPLQKEHSLQYQISKLAEKFDKLKGLPPLE